MKKPIELAVWKDGGPMVSRMLHGKLKGYVEVCIHSFNGRWKRVEGPNENSCLVFLDTHNEIVGALPLPEPIMEMVTTGTILLVLQSIFREGTPGVGHGAKYGFVSEVKLVNDWLYGEVMRRNRDLENLSRE